MVLCGPRLISLLILTGSISGFVSRRCSTRRLVADGRFSGAPRWRWAGGGKCQVLPGVSRWGGGSCRWKVAACAVLGATTTFAWQILRGGWATRENSHWGEIWRLFVNVNENVSCDLQILSALGLGKDGYKGCLASLPVARAEGRS